MDSELHAFCTKLIADREKGQEFSAKARAVMIALLKADQSQSNIAHTFDTTSSTILRAKEQ